MASEVRVRMIEAMGRIGGKRAVEPLKNALEDDDKAVRQATAAELERRS